jgi:hypothetical protein
MIILYLPIAYHEKEKVINLRLEINAIHAADFSL